MSDKLSKDDAKAIVTEILKKANARFKQEVQGENEEFLDRVVLQYRGKVARHSWKASQKWCKWTDEGPVLMPDYTRLYYRKGNTEILVMEYPPQVRLMKFHGSLAKRASSTSEMAEGELKAVHTYSLALPYVVFVFKFVNGIFTEVRCAFSDRPLKRLEEKPMRPYLSNLDSNMSVCLGVSFDRSLLMKDNIVQQSALVLSHFWQTVYSDEWSRHYWDNKTHFDQNDPRMASLDAWQQASIENPLFVVEDVKWLPFSEDNFGDMVVRMFEDDHNNGEFQEDLYKELVDNFLTEVKKTFHDNIDSVEQKMSDALVDQLANELLTKINN